MARVGWYRVGLAALLAWYVAAAGWVPPADDEIYYWCWSEHLQPSYFDHPPMTALMIRASTELFGHSVRAVRLPACLASVAVLAIIGWLTRPRHVLAWVVLTPLYTFGAVLITPDTPLMLFWAGYLGWLVVVHRKLDGPCAALDGATPRDGHRGAFGECVIPLPHPASETGRIPPWLWLVGGVILGCGALGKYTTALAVPAGFVSFLLAGRGTWRRWLPGYVGHGIVSAIVATPILAFNLQHDFAPLRFQLAHAVAGAEGEGGLAGFAEFAGVQVLLFGWLPLVLLPWVVWNARTLAADPRLRACAALYAVPLAFFLYKATRGPLEGNWALASYVGFWPVAACWYERWAVTRVRRWVAVSTFAIPAGCVIFLAVHLAKPVGALAAHRDRITRQGVKMDVAALAAAAVKAHGERVPVYTPSYQWTALLRFHGADARQIAGATRPSHFTMPPEHLTDADRAYVFNEGPLYPEFSPGFDPPKVVAMFPFTVRGETLTYFSVLLYTRTPGGKEAGGPTLAAR